MFYDSKLVKFTLSYYIERFFRYIHIENFVFNSRNDKFNNWKCSVQICNSICDKKYVNDSFFFQNNLIHRHEISYCTLNDLTIIKIFNDNYLVYTF